MYTISESLLPAYNNGQCPFIKTYSDVTFDLSSINSTMGESSKFPKS